MYPPPNALRAPLTALMLGLPAIVAVQTASLWLLAREAPTASVSLERLADAFARPAAVERPLPAAPVEPPVVERVAVAERAPVEPAAPVVPAPPPAVAAAIVDAPQPLAPVERPAAAVVPHPVAEPVTPPPVAHAAPAEPAAVVPPAAAASPAAVVPVEAVAAAPAPVVAPAPPAAAPAPVEAPPAAAEAVAPAPAAPVAAAPEPAAPIPGLLGPDWVKAQPPRQRTLLLRTEPTLDALRRWLAGRDLELPLAVVESRESGRRGYALLGGSYADSNEAAAAAKALAKRSGVRAWVRRFDQVLPAAGG